ncbi:MAG: hypothetical protein IKT04_04145 [Clostridia bacterium]|nr:hypothetical protein [Clostridia bacterium]
MKALKKALYILVPIAIAYLELFILPDYLKKKLTTLSKKLEKEEIDVDNLGPEIVKK